MVLDLGAAVLVGVENLRGGLKPLALVVKTLRRGVRARKMEAIVVMVKLLVLLRPLNNGGVRRQLWKFYSAETFLEHVK